MLNTIKGLFWMVELKACLSFYRFALRHCDDAGKRLDWIRRRCEIWEDHNLNDERLQSIPFIKELTDKCVETEQHVICEVSKELRNELKSYLKDHTI